jgi:hypothetical protein
MYETVVYIDRSDIRQGKLNELKVGIRSLITLADHLEPQLVSYSFHIDEEAEQMSVVVVHPDTASLEFHMEVLAAEFRKLAPLLTLRSIEVFGAVSDSAMALLQKKAADLGQAEISVRQTFAGFSHLRLPMDTRQSRTRPHKVAERRPAPPGPVSHSSMPDSEFE